MPHYFKHDVILVRYPFSDLSGSKIRPAVVVSEPHKSQDLFIVALTSKVFSLLAGEFALLAWSDAGLNVPIAVKRGLFTVNNTLIVKTVGHLAHTDEEQLDLSLRTWLGLF